MSVVALICGIFGGTWAIAVSVWFLVMVVWHGGFSSPKFLLGFWISIFVMLMGALSLTAIALRAKKPRLTSTLTWVSIVGIFLVSNLDPPALWILFWPAAILLIPAAVKMGRMSRLEARQSNGNKQSDQGQYRDGRQGRHGFPL